MLPVSVRKNWEHVWVCDGSVRRNENKDRLVVILFGFWLHREYLPNTN